MHEQPPENTGRCITPEQKCKGNTKSRNDKLAILEVTWKRHDTDIKISAIQLLFEDKCVTMGAILR